MAYWQIIAIDEYIEQFGEIPIGIQNNIVQIWNEVAERENPRDVGHTDDCGKNEEDCPYIVVRFVGIAYEFVYKMDKANRILTLINCERLTFLDHGQT